MVTRLRVTQPRGRRYRSAEAGDAACSGGGAHRHVDALGAGPHCVSRFEELELGKDVRETFETYRRLGTPSRGRRGALFPR